MERAKLAFFVAVAFFAAAFLGALAFRSDDLLRPAGRAQAILVEVENEGHDATVADRKSVV